MTADFDWRQTGPQSWDIVAETDAGQMVLSAGGAKLAVAGRVVHEEPEAEYPMLYKRFAEIVRAGVSDVDLAPLRHVADAFMLGTPQVRGAVLRLNAASDAFDAQPTIAMAKPS